MDGRDNTNIQEIVSALKQLGREKAICYSDEINWLKELPSRIDADNKQKVLNQAAIALMAGGMARGSGVDTKEDAKFAVEQAKALLAELYPEEKVKRAGNPTFKKGDVVCIRTILPNQHKRIYSNPFLVVDVDLDNMQYSLKYGDTITFVSIACDPQIIFAEENPDLILEYMEKTGESPKVYRQKMEARYDKDQNNNA